MDWEKAIRRRQSILAPMVHKLGEDDVGIVLEMCYTFRTEDANRMSKICL